MAIRAEPYLWASGKLAKDDGAYNIIAEEIKPLKVQQRPPSFEISSSYSPTKFLKTLRRTPPAAKSWG
jgi:hypothetical protein